MILGLKVHSFSCIILDISLSFCSCANFVCFYLSRFQALWWIGTQLTPDLCICSNIFLDLQEGYWLLFLFIPCFLLFYFYAQFVVIFEYLVVILSALSDFFSKGEWLLLFMFDTFICELFCCFYRNGDIDFRMFVLLFVLRVFCPAMYVSKLIPLGFSALSNPQKDTSAWCCFLLRCCRVVSAFMRSLVETESITCLGCLFIYYQKLQFAVELQLKSSFFQSQAFLLIHDLSRLEKHELSKLLEIYPRLQYKLLQPYHLLIFIISKMNRTCNQNDKENEEPNFNQAINPKIKWALLKRHQEMPKNVNYNLRTAFKKHKRSDSCPIVDEVSKKVNHVSKKEKSHLGEQAFMPISLQTLKRSFEKCSNRSYLLAR